MVNAKGNIDKLIPGGVPCVNHNPAKGTDEWRAQLETVTSELPSEYIITKTLVFKPSETCAFRFYHHLVLTLGP